MRELCEGVSCEAIEMHRQDSPAKAVGVRLTSHSQRLHADLVRSGLYTERIGMLTGGEPWNAVIVSGQQQRSV